MWSLQLFRHRSRSAGVSAYWSHRSGLSLRLADSLLRWRRGRRFIGHGEHLSVTQIHPLHLLTVEGARPSASKHGKLISALVYCTVTVDSLRDGQSRTMSVISRNQLRRGPRAEAAERRVIGRRE